MKVKSPRIDPRIKLILYQRLIFVELTIESKMIEWGE